MDYSRRFGIEEGFRDEKSGGFDLEAGCIRNAQKLERLMLILATAQIVAVSEGMSATLEGKQEEVDPSKIRSLSYFQIGLRWVEKWLIYDIKKLFGHFHLRPMNDPIPVASTKKESRKRRKRKDPTYLFKDVQFGTL
jgi:hypothetical protein